MKHSGPDEIAVGKEQQAVTNGDNKNNLRRAALSEIDNAPFGWYHIKTIVVAGTDFFTDAYDLFTANFITTMIAWHSTS